ncbi:OsmC family protein [Fulvivirgaceae bacterium BMA10]|uniref:OsmC family protein n=1 Tax=Splendidivirga corallicola TaxID=3051826 RepID=A0ABT8KS16_9BACT|nr:OsmC family protein [Fulvivirgaceae bacterium BMA10]
MSTVKYSGELRTEAVHLKSGKEIVTDAPVDNNGKGEAFSPTDLVSTALVSCMMTIMGIEARKENIELAGLSAEVTKLMKADPRRIGKIRIEFQWESPQGTEEQIEKLKQAALTCPVALSLDPALTQEVNFNF